MKPDDDVRGRSLLVELFVEELPPKALKKLGEAFAGGLLERLRACGLASDGSRSTGFASPRRLAVHVTRVAARAADQSLSRKLMPSAVGLDASGNATPALLKKLQSLGADAQAVRSLERVQDGKTEALFYRSTVPGATLAAGLQRALDETIASLPIPKAMTYQLESNCELPGWSSVSFVRPAHGLVALHGSDVVAVSALGLEAGRETRGHRFEARVDPIRLRDADGYAEQLKSEGAVIASFDERRAQIARQLEDAADAVGSGARPIQDDALLDEVTALVERPNVLVCEFEPEFLEVPAECLILTMKANQKYFPLLDAGGRLTNKFLVVSNISPDDTSAVVQGNERVVRPRLADAKFFFDQDRKRTLESRVGDLAKVVYHNKLGTQRERVERVRRIARWVAGRVGADGELAALADRAALLAKADLTTDMVGEFPELQGVMGGYYARHDGENERVAQAIADQYLLKRGEPQDRTTGDPSNLVSMALVLADRAETLIGIWGIGLKPTGDKDPFALRRHALTVIHQFEAVAFMAALDRTKVELDLDGLLHVAADTFAPAAIDGSTIAEVKNFIYERYWNQLAALQGLTTVGAVIVLQPPLHEVNRRVAAVVEFLRLSEAPALAAANKRIANILKRAPAATTTAAAPIDEALLREPAEQSLFAAMHDITPRADALFDAGDYTGSLQALAGLRAPVDAFFDTVMVNAEDAALRANRLALLASLHRAMNRVADLSRLAAA